MKPPTKSPSLHAAMRRKSFATLGRLSHLLARAQHAGGLRVWTPPLAIPAASLQKRRRRASNRQTKPVGVTLSAGPDRRSDEIARLEAALYVAREPLTTRRLAKLARLTDGTRARTLLKELKRLHESSGSAFRVEQIAGGFQLLTRAQKLNPFGESDARKCCDNYSTGISSQLAAELKKLAGPTST